MGISTGGFGWGQGCICQPRRRLRAKRKSRKVEVAKAKELVRARSHRGRLRVMRSHIAGLAQNTDLVRSADAVQGEIAHTTRLLGLWPVRCQLCASGVSGVCAGLWVGPGGWRWSW